MAELWYRELGFYNNPFSIKPAAYTNEVVGYNLATIFKKIERAQPLFIVGPFGAGKTTILKHIVGRFGGQRKVIYFSCGIERAMNPGQLLRGAGSFMDRLTGRAPTGIIFLIDEASDIFPKDAQELYNHYRDGAIKSLVFVGTDIPGRKLPAGLASDLKGNIINLHAIAPKAAITLVRRRVGNLPLLPDRVIRELHRRAGGNTRRMLEYCEELCKLAVSRGLRTATRDEIDELFPLPKKPAPARKKAPAREPERHRDDLPYDQAIEEAILEVETDAPVMEGMHEIKDNEPLPDDDLYESPLKKKRAKKRK